MRAKDFRYDGKRVLVVGGATGMGAATAELLVDLGATVVVMDAAPVAMPEVHPIAVDLRDKASIDAAIGECGGPIDALFSCAGVADGTAGIEKINFLGHRHLIDCALSQKLLSRGSAIGMISSAAGLAWEKDIELVKEYLDTAGFEEGAAWIAAHPDKATYMWSKQAICTYVAREAFTFSKLGIRINAILPGPTDTPLAQANADLWLGFGADFRAAAGLEPSRPDEQAGPLVFLCSDAASYLTGVTVITDGGYVAAGITGSFPPASPVVDFLYGRY